jgi:DNA-binding transcriptional LysR family regulator
MQPTPQAQAMHDGVRAAIEALDNALSYRLKFDPLTTERTFRIAMTDIGQIVLLPRLLDELATAAPRAGLDICNLDDRTPQRLESGELDLAVGFMAGVPGGIYQQALFNERFACLARSDHPRIREAPTLQQFQAESHVLVVTSGTGHLIVDRRLETLGLERRVAVRIPNFLGLATVIGMTDHLCTLPRRAALVMARGGGVAAWELPFALPDYVVKQHWHERQMRDPGTRWLRGLMSSLFRSRDEAAAPVHAVGEA